MGTRAGDDDDDPLTDLDVEIRLSHARGVATGTPDALPADSEPSTMEPQTVDPRLGVRLLAAAASPPAPSKPAKADREDTAPFELDDESELSIQTVEARVIDAHRGLVARKIQKSPTIRGMGPAVSAKDVEGGVDPVEAGIDEGETVKVFPPKSEPDDLELPEDEDAEHDKEEVTALDTSLLAGGKDLAATAAAAAALAKPPNGSDDEDDEPPTASVRRPPMIALPSNDLVTDPGVKAAADVSPAIPRPATVPLAAPLVTPLVIRAATPALPDPGNRTLEMPRPAFVKTAASSQEQSAARGPHGTSKVAGGHAGATPVSFVDASPARARARARAPVEPKRSRGFGTFAVVVLVALAFAVGVGGTLFIVKRESSNVGAVAPSSPSASSPTVAASESPAPPAAVPSVAPSVAASTSAHRAPPPLTGPRPPVKPAPKSSLPVHL